jgi:alkylation response protein AidB-like acyl-CoA dehydrogenase
MGLKASATTFGQHDIPSVGWRVGGTHDGISQMFKIMEFARMMVGTKAPRISTIQHADVRRSLLRQKAYALYLYAAAHQDPVSAKIVSGAAQLLPIVKALGSERSYQRLTESLQTLGNSGYLQDYPIEQFAGLAVDSQPYRHPRVPPARAHGPTRECWKPRRLSADARQHGQDTVHEHLERLDEIA